MVRADSLLKNLGKPSTGPEVLAMLEALGLSKEDATISDGVSTDVGVPDHGITLFFKTARYLSNLGLAEGVPHNMPMLSEVRFASEDPPSACAFAGELPHGLHFSDSRAEVRERLGAPSWSAPFVANDRWEQGDHYMTVVFTREQDKIRWITCGLIGLV